MVPTSAKVRFLEGNTLIGKANSNHLIPIDTAESSGGGGGANDPVQLLVTACAGCVAIDVVNIIRKARHEIRRLIIDVSATRFPAPPKVLRTLEFHATIDGEGIGEPIVRRALNLSLTNYCSVSLSLDRSIGFTVGATINGQEIPAWSILRDPAIYARAVE
ncbi:OsmC family protein [candidate division KSB1 bacterium]|nr:OsmC family protein [candidate division KSB1 bacterium]